jgi:hypothetical protein
MTSSRVLTTALAVSFALGAAASASAQTVLNAHAAPANNGGSAGWAIFFDLLSPANNVVVTEMVTASTAAANAAYSVEVFVRSGTALGGPVGTGAGSSTAGWTSLGVAPATQGPVASSISLPIDIPDIALTAGQVTGVAVRFTGAGPRYFGTGTPPVTQYSDANLSLTTGDSRSAPFTPTGSFFSSRELVGSVTYVTGPTGPTTYCTAGTSTNGCVPAISGSGTPSVAAISGFVIDVLNVEGQKSGLLFYGINGQNSAPWGVGGTSFLCVKAPTQRMTTQNSGGTSNACDGLLSEDWLAFVASHPGALGVPFSSGQTVNAQGWYRDPPAVKTTNLSDGLEFVLVP